jgi:tetratricopeptide (TPR) repeat protein
VAKLGLSLTQKGDISAARAQILLSLSAVQATNGKIQEAEYNMEEAASIFSKLMRKEKHATVLCNLSEIQIWQGKFAQAIKNTEKALNLSRNTMFRSGEAHAHLSLGMAMKALGLYERAIPHISECIRIGKDSGLNDYRIPCQYLYTKVHTQLKNHKASEKHVIDGILLCEEGDPERHLPSLRALRAEQLIILGNSKEAQQIIHFVEEDIHDLPWPRRLETMLFIARSRKLLKQNKSAQALARFINKHAVQRGLWKTSIASLQLLLELDPTDTIAYTQHLTQLEAIKRNIPPQFLESYLSKQKES